MNKTVFYPGKTRIYSSGRWEAWNRLPSADCNTKNYVKVKKIRGLNSGKFIREEKTSNKNTETRVTDRSSANSSNIKKHFLHVKKKDTNLPNLNQTNASILNFQHFQEYACGMNIKGCKFNPNITISNRRVIEISPLRTRREFRKKPVDFFYHFSLNNTPTPWNVPIKSSMELS